MENTIQKTYKRQDRSVSPETAQKISNSLKSYNATHPRNPEWCQKIADGVHDYWQQIPQRKKEDGGGAPMDGVFVS